MKRPVITETYSKGTETTDNTSYDPQKEETNDKVIEHKLLMSIPLRAGLLLLLLQEYYYPHPELISGHFGGQGGENQDNQTSFLNILQINRSLTLI